MDSTDSPKSITLDYLPISLWIHILSFLPAKSLVKFRALCKLFLTLISDPYLVHSHLRNFAANFNESRTLTLEPDETELLKLEDEINDLEREWSDDLEFRYNAACEIFEVGRPGSKKWIDRGPSFRHDGWVVAGSVDGVLLIYDEGGQPAATLWNPSIRKYHPIPLPADSVPIFNHVKFGFGYDDSCGDYKALAMIDPALNNTSKPIHSEEELESAAGTWVYSVKTRSWLKGKLPDCPHKRKASQSVYFKGGMVWIEGVKSSQGYYHQLVRFDFATNSFIYSWLPYPIKNNLWIKSRLVMIDGGSSLGVWGLDSWGVASIWAMDETAKSTWIRLYDIGEGVWRMRAFGIGHAEMVWEFWTKRDKPKVSFYDEEKPWERRFAGVYLESLVLLN